MRIPKSVSVSLSPHFWGELELGFLNTFFIKVAISPLDNQLFLSSSNSSNTYSKFSGL